MVISLIIRYHLQKKIDNKKQTGSGGGPDCKFTDTDQLIIDIIGRESPTIIGLPITETWQMEPTPRPSSSTSVTCSIKPIEIENVDLPNCSSATTIVDKMSEKQTKKRKSTPSENEIELRNKKLRLSLEIMEKESYLKNLEILKLVKELCIPHSKFTEGIPTEYVFFEDNEDDILH